MGFEVWAYYANIFAGQFWSFSGFPLWNPKGREYAQVAWMTSARFHFNVRLKAALGVRSSQRGIGQ